MNEKSLFLKKNQIEFILLLIGFFGCIIIYFNSQEQLNNMYGDMAVYISQSMSFAYDYDNIFDQNDLDRFFREVSATGPRGLFINAHNGKYYFSKPMGYSLVMAPLVRILGVKGILIGNWLMLLMTVYLMNLYLKVYNSRWLSILVPSLLFFFSLALPYIFVAHADIFLAFLMSLILYCFHKYESSENGRSDKWLGVTACIIGFSVYQRSPFVFFAFAIWLKIVRGKKYRDAAMIVLIALIPFCIMSGIQLIQTGSYTCYNGERFYIETFVDGLRSNINNLEMAKIELNDRELFQRLLSNIKNVKVLALNFIYYFVGRQTGVLIYAPFALCTIVLIFDKKIIKEKWHLVIGLVLYMLFFFWEDPTNYYGGSQSFGNRYMLHILPIFVFLLEQIKIKKYCVSAFFAGVLGSVTLSPVVLSPQRWVKDEAIFMERDVIRRFPLELTLFPSIKPMMSAYSITVDDVEILVENSFPIEEQNFFWTKGKEKCKVYMRSLKPIESVEICTESLNKTENISIDLKDEKTILGKYFYTITFDFPEAFYPQENWETSDVRLLGRRIEFESINYKDTL